VISQIYIKKEDRVHTCCDELPAYRPTRQGPIVAREDPLLSSCHAIVASWPAGRLEVAVGLVILGDEMSPKIADASMKYPHKRSHGQKEQWQQE